MYSGSDSVPDCWDIEDGTPSGYLTDSEGRGCRIGDVNHDGELASADALMNCDEETAMNRDYTKKLF